MNKLVSIALLMLGAIAAAGADIHVPIDAYKLNNGLRVILSRDNAIPVVTVYVAYDVGSRSEERGRSGFAHLFEHMMFQGSANIPKGAHFAAVESNGGSLNGSTSADFTDYFETLPSNKLATGLWLESDRMRSLSITEENLKNQKEAVKQERRLSVDNQPYNTAVVDIWPSLLFGNWQNAHSTIGSFEDLNASTVDDVSQFFKTHYAPNNAVLVIVGDIEPGNARKLIETYFGDIPSHAAPKRPDLTEPPFKPRRETYQDPLAEVPAVVIGYPGPKRRSQDFYSMALIDAILTGADSSRFYLDLVKGKQSVIQYDTGLGWPFANARDYRDPEPWGGMLVYKPNFTAEQVVAQVQDEIAKLQNTPVEAKELERVKTRLRADRIRELQSSFNRAHALAQFQLADGDPGLINTEIDELMAVTPQQIQAAASKYLTPDKRAFLDIQPAPKTKSTNREGTGTSAQTGSEGR